MEEQAELLRKRLSRRPNFNMHEAFLAIDREQNGYITRVDLSKVLQENRVYATEGDLWLLTSRFDRNKDGRISYSEFVEEFIPKSPGK